MALLFWHVDEILSDGVECGKLLRELSLLHANAALFERELQVIDLIYDLQISVWSELVLLLCDWEDRLARQIFHIRMQTRSTLVAPIPLFFWLVPLSPIEINVVSERIQDRHATINQEGMDSFCLANRY